MTLYSSWYDKAGSTLYYLTSSCKKKKCYSNPDIKKAISQTLECFTKQLACTLQKCQCHKNLIQRVIKDWKHMTAKWNM